MKIKMKNVFVEIYYLINQIEKYHDLLKQIYIIIVAEISEINLNLDLQMTKTINNLIDFDNLVFILLIFEVYLKMIEFDVPFLTIN